MLGRYKSIIFILFVLSMVIVTSNNYLLAMNIEINTSDDGNLRKKVHVKKDEDYKKRMDEIKQKRENERKAKEEQQQKMAEKQKAKEIYEKECTSCVKNILVNSEFEYRTYYGLCSDELLIKMDIYSDIIELLNKKCARPDLGFARISGNGICEARNELAAKIDKNDCINKLKSSFFDNFSKDDGYKTVGNAFDSFFDRPKWSALTDDFQVVFTGVAMNNGNKSLYKFVFHINPTFQRGILKDVGWNKVELYINNNPINDKSINDIISTIMLN